MASDSKAISLWTRSEILCKTNRVRRPGRWLRLVRQRYQPWRKLCRTIAAAALAWSSGSQIR